MPNRGNTMRKIMLVAALAALTGTAANATTWVATCTDGKNVQYVQTVKGAGYLYLRTAKDYFQAARLTQTSDSETVVCGTVVGNAEAGQPPVSELCIDKSRQEISLKYRKPGASALEDVGVYCAAVVTLRATNLKEH
jgi:hypothetical protein